MLRMRRQRVSELTLRMESGVVDNGPRSAWGQDFGETKAWELGSVEAGETEFEAEKWKKKGSRDKKRREDW